MTGNWLLAEKEKARDFIVEPSRYSWSMIEPNMIYNRLDLIRQEPCILLRIYGERSIIHVSVCFVGNTAVLGIWGTEVSQGQM